LREHHFTSSERQYIYGLLLETFHTNRSLLTKKVFEYEIGARIDDKERTYFIGEWNTIEAVTTTEPAEVLIQKLDEAHVGRELSRIGDEVDGFLEKGQINEALAHLKQNAVSVSIEGEDRPVVDLTDTHDREKTILDKKNHPEKYRGLKIGFEMADRASGGQFLFPGELTLIAGVTGTGKSTLVRQIQKNVVVLNPGVNVLHIANEEYQEQVEHKFDALFTEIPYLDFKTGDITPENMARWKQYMQDWKEGKVSYGRVFIKEVPAFTDVTLAEQAYRELEGNGVKIGLITIDHLPHIKPIQQAWGENDERFKAAADCKELARWLKLPVVVPTQAATVVEGKQQKGKRAGKLDVYGSKGQVHVANNFIIITDKGKAPDQEHLPEWQRDVIWLLDAKKTRDGPPWWFKARHIVKYGRVEATDDGNMGAPATDIEAIVPHNQKGSDGEHAAAVDEALADVDSAPEGAHSNTESTPPSVENPTEKTASLMKNAVLRLKKGKNQQ